MCQKYSNVPCWKAPPPPKGPSPDEDEEGDEEHTPTPPWRKARKQEGRPQRGGGVLQHQKQLPREHPGGQLEAPENTDLWFITRTEPEEPTVWASSACGILEAGKEVVEVYYQDKEEIPVSVEAQGDAQLKQLTLTRADRRDLVQGLGKSKQRLIPQFGACMWLAVLTLATALYSQTTSTGAEAFPVDVAEVYSEPRVTARAQKHDLTQARQWIWPLFGTSASSSRRTRPDGRSMSWNRSC